MSSACVSHRLWFLPFWMREPRAYTGHTHFVYGPHAITVDMCVCALWMISHFAVHHEQDRTSKACRYRATRAELHTPAKHRRPQICARTSGRSEKKNAEKNGVNVKQQPSTITSTSINSISTTQRRDRRAKNEYRENRNAEEKLFSRLWSSIKHEMWHHLYTHAINCSQTITILYIQHPSPPLPPSTFRPSLPLSTSHHPSSSTQLSSWRVCE